MIRGLLVAVSIGIAGGFLVGCSAVQIAPETKGQQLIVTPIGGASAQLVAKQQVQQKVIQVKPVGKKWGSVKLDVAVGRPLTKSVASYVTALIPSTRVGDRDDGQPAAVIIELVDASIEIGTNDSTAHNTGMFIPLALFAMDAEALASINVDATVAYCGGEPRSVSVSGKASEIMNYSAIGFPELERLMAVAMDDAARALSERVMAGLRSCG